MAVITMIEASFAKAQVENFWDDASNESVKKLIKTLGAAVAAANTIKCYFNKADIGTVH